MLPLPNQTTLFIPPTTPARVAPASIRSTRRALFHAPPSLVLLLILSLALAQSWTTLRNTSLTPRHEAAFLSLHTPSGLRAVLLGGHGVLPTEIYNPQTITWSSRPAPPLELHHFQPVAVGATIYIPSAGTGGFPREASAETSTHTTPLPAHGRRVRRCLHRDAAKPRPPSSTTGRSTSATATRAATAGTPRRSRGSMNTTLQATRGLPGLMPHCARSCWRRGCDD